MLNLRGGDRYIQGFRRETRESNRLEDLDLDGRNRAVLKYV